jgi:hypothetical protein
MPGHLTEIDASVYTLFRGFLLGPGYLHPAAARGRRL